MHTDFASHVRQCNSCPARIIWARTLTGRSMPVDAEPTEGGNVLLENRQGFVRAVVYAGPEAAAYEQHIGPLRKSHFATCPDADTWRKR